MNNKMTSEKTNEQPESTSDTQQNFLSGLKIEQLNKQPIIESTVAKSEDGKWLIHKTTITDIKPVSYFDKILAKPS